MLQLLRFLLVLVETLSTNAIMMTALPMLFSVLEYTLGTATSDLIELFMEDSLQLWNRVCHLPSITYSETMHSLFQVLLPLYSKEMNCFNSVMGIIDAYLDLGGGAFLQVYQSTVATMYSTLLGVVSVKDLRRLTTSMHILLVMYPEQGVEIIAPSIGRVLGEIYLNWTQQNERYVMVNDDDDDSQ